MSFIDTNEQRKPFKLNYFLYESPLTNKGIMHIIEAVTCRMNQWRYKREKRVSDRS